MIGSKIIALAQLLTNTNTASFLDATEANIYEHLNTLYGERVLDILRIRVDKNATLNKATLTHFSTVGLSEGDVGYLGEYPFPADLIRPVRMEVSYDGETWLKAQIYDNYLNNKSEYNEDQIESQFSKQSPRVDYARDSFMIRPTKNDAGDITAGIYIEYEQRQDDFTSSTSPSHIEPNLQDILAYDLADLEFIMHADRHSDKQIALFNVKKQALERKFFDHYKKGLNSKKKMTFAYEL